MSGEPLNYHDLESSGTGTRLGKSSALQKLAVFVLFVVALLVIATLALVVKLHTGQKSQQDSLDAIRAEMSAGSNSLTSELPDRYIVPNVPSRKYQETRGTCWDFGTIAAVEHQYRLQAIQRGALQPNQFVRFSEQAYGHEIITLCAMSQYHSRCLLPGDRVAFNSTEGGEATLLFSFHNELKQGLLPDSLCPYIPDKDNSSCPGIDQAIPKNPVSFTLQSFSTLYDVESIKAALVHKQYAMPITIPVWTVSYYMPCTDPAFGLNSSHPGCDPAKPSCRPCPPDLSTTSPCCLEHSAPFYNMEGEFRQHHAMQLEAGHVMMLVGYNDEFVTKDGLKGGFIIRNTWRDGVYSFNEFGERKARGSHSIPYFMQTVGEASERLLCPNSYNPRNWYTCGAPTEDGKLSSQLASCTGSDTTSTAQANLVPLELVCDSRGTLCKPDANTIYYNINQTQYGDGLHILCFLQHNTATDAVSEFCLTPTPIDEIATSFVPRTPLSNQDDYCGFYIMPYELYEQSKATFLSGWVNDYQLSFSDSSFAVNSAQYPQFDYSLVKASTMTQQPLPTWTNPLPVGPMSLQAAKQRR